jgi:hypothetical protein
MGKMYLFANHPEIEDLFHRELDRAAALAVNLR